MSTADRYGPRIEGAGWVTFAGIMLILVGCFNVIDGIAAIRDSRYLAHQLLFSNLHAWGWFFLIWGIIQVLAGFALFAAQGWAIILGVVTAFGNIIAQLSWSHTYPVWSISAMVIDVLIIYGLIVHAGDR